MRSSIIQFIQGSRLRNKFVFFFVLLAVVPVLVLGGVALYLIDLSHRQDVSRLELQLIDQKIEEIEKFFADTLGILEVRVGYTEELEIPLAAQEFLLEGLLAENKAFDEVSFISVGLLGEGGPGVGAITRDPGTETAKKFRYRDIGEDKLYNVSNLLKFQEPQKGNDFISDVHHTLSGPVVTLSAPVRNRNNDIIQILSAEVNLSEITRSIETSYLGIEGYLVLVDRGGTLIAHRGRGRILPGTNLIALERVSQVLGGKTLDALGEHDRYESFFGAREVVGAGKKIPKIGWVILAEWPLRDADSVISDIRNEVAAIALFGIVAVLLMAPFFAGRLVDPIRILQKNAEEIAKGNFTKKVEIKTGDELEDLGSAFNDMASGLKRLKELQEEFVFIAAHDLSAPVTVIKGYLSLIFEGDAGPLSSKMKDYLGQTQLANERLIKLVEDLLEVARSEAGRIVIKVKPMDIRESIQGTITQIGHLAEEKSQSLAYEPPPKLPQVLADDDRIREVVSNLISNAVKYTQEGGEIRIFNELRGKEVITHVQDNGYGMPKEAQGRLFEKFYRVQTKAARDVSGTGLGLFIVKQLIEKMNGKIWFESEEGKGSKFSFSLPIKE